MQTILYCRTSVAEQTIAHQRSQAEAAGFKINEVVADEGVSGLTTTLKDRPQGRRLFDLLRTGDTLVVRWVDRLGRNYADVCETIREMMRRGVVVRTVINGLTFDGAAKSPMDQAVRDALIGFMAATAEAQGIATKEAQKAGIEHARRRDDAYRGRKPSFSRKQYDAVRAALGQELTISQIAAATGLTRQTIYRIRDYAADAEAALTRWAA